MGKAKDVARFCFLNFPLEIILCLLIMPGMLFVPELFLFLLIYLIFIVGIILLSRSLFIKAVRPFYKFLVLDLAHTIFLAPLIFVFVAGIGGTSQAVVEGVAGNIFARYTQYAVYTIFALLLAQILIIPWSLFCGFVMKKKPECKNC